LGWMPKAEYKEGFEKTIKWHFATKTRMRSVRNSKVFRQNDEKTTNGFR
jgi:dTDP-D-glucose 4,6-dehydratase